MSDHAERAARRAARRAGATVEGVAGADVGVRHEDPSPSLDLDDLTYDELYAKAKDLDIEGRSSMTKGELIDAMS